MSVITWKDRVHDAQPEALGQDPLIHVFEYLKPVDLIRAAGACVHFAWQAERALSLTKCVYIEDLRALKRYLGTSSFAETVKRLPKLAQLELGGACTWVEELESLRELNIPLTWSNIKIPSISDDPDVFAIQYLSQLSEPAKLEGYISMVKWMLPAMVSDLVALMDPKKEGIDLSMPEAIAQDFLSRSGWKSVTVAMLVQRVREMFTELPSELRRYPDLIIADREWQKGGAKTIFNPPMSDEEATTAIEKRRL